LLSVFIFLDRIYRIFQDFFLFFSSFHLPAIASRHVRHRLRLRQCRAGSGKAGGDETEKTPIRFQRKIN